MTPALSQRWQRRRTSFRPFGEVIDPSEFDVAPIDSDGTARAFVVQHHYSASYPAARWRFGLYRRGVLVGVAVFSHPVNDLVLTSVFPGRATDSVELGRLVLLPEVLFNGETWMIARCFEQLRREGLAGVVSFSDPVRRASSEGAPVFIGHVGQIYQASNGIYLGRGTARTLRLLPGGQVFSARAASKIRARERGWEYAVAQLVEAGAAKPSANECGADGLRAWLGRWLPEVTRPLKHGGNHRYAFPLHRSARRQLPASLPFPRQIDGTSQLALFGGAA